MLPDPNDEAKRHALLALLAEVYGAGMARQKPEMRQWLIELDQIYAFHAEHQK